ncbi:MAG: tetratricopeptide repeat protein, partial [Gemmataceae bacterium]|nr:tetratricopeptide repeat protein [Gemmataceae bacterium]
LAAASARWGKPDEARRRWEEVAGLRPKDLAVRFRLLDLAFQSGDRARVDAAVEAVRRADGPGGAQTQYAEGLAVVSRTAATPAELADARLHLTASAALRPTWPFPVGMLGLALDREGKPDEALAAYLRAVDLGDRRPVVIRRAVQLLYDRRRIDEADRLVQKLGPAESLSPELTRLAADVSLANNQLDRAVALAGAAVAADSKEPVDHLWQAQVLAGAGKTDEAVAALRRATAVAGGKGGPWVALVRTLLQAGRKDEAEKVIAGLGEKLTGPELTLTQAQCQELAGRGERAEALYKEAAGARPGDPAAVRMLAGYYERQGNLPAAVPALRGLLAASPPPPADDQAWTRRVLAAALARTGEYKDFREGLGLIDQNLAARPGNPADLVAKAQVLATRLVHRRDAVAVLEGLQKQGPLVPAAQFVYGQLLADTGPWAAARAVLLDALARDGDNPAYLRAFVDRLLKNDQAGEAGAWLDRLDRLAPGDPEGARLRATWLARRGRGAEAADLV